MAATVTTHSSPAELSDEQVDQMLARAAARLREKQQQLANAKEPATTASTGPMTFNFPKLNPGDLTAKKDVAAAAPKTMEVGLRKVEDPVAAMKAKKEKKKATAGAMWFDMPRTELTPELKRDLQLIKMRSVLDPHRMYKKENEKMEAPEFSQVGTVVEGPTEYFTARLDNKQRKRTFVEEVLAGEQETKRFKRKYGELQEKTTSGKKAFYKALKEKRKGGVKKSSAG